MGASSPREPKHKTDFAFCSSINIGIDRRTFYNMTIHGNAINSPGIYTPAGDRSIDDIERVITHGSPQTIVVDFQTTFVWQIAACQSHC